MTIASRIPRLIWIYWDKGIDHAPPIVQICMNSWKVNSGWNIVFIDDNSLGKYLDLKLQSDCLEKVGVTKKSNLIRLQLLAKYGGVWVDATCFCVRGLDSWIDEVLISGFFAFSRPGKDRLLSTWFLAAEPQNPLILEVERQFVRFYERYHSLSGSSQNSLNRIVGKALRFFLSRHWVLSPLLISPAFIGISSKLPYFSFHYIFAKVVLKNRECRRIWKITPKRNALLPHLLHKLGAHKKADPQTKAYLSSIDAPVFKLSWKRAPIAVASGSLFDYVLFQRDLLFPQYSLRSNHLGDSGLKPPQKIENALSAKSGERIQ
jgi:hypothetical protein